MSIDLHCNGKNSFCSKLKKKLNYYDFTDFNHDAFDDSTIKRQEDFDEREMRHLLEKYYLALAKTRFL